MKNTMKFLAACLLCLHCLFAGAQKTSVVVATATDMITHNRYDNATHYLDSLIKRNPRNVDALMMKGNVLLNYAWQNTAKPYFNLERAESVFDTSAIGAGLFVPVIAEDTSKLIENYWRTCLRIDSTRTDIKKGLCNLLSVSLRTEDLKKQLGQMKKLITANEENAYQYAEYARNLKNRGKFDEGLEVYQYIANMFPNLAGIRCDMAGEYFYNGHPREALNYIDSTLSKKEVDQTSFINAATIYSMLGYYDNAQQTFKRYSEQDTLLVADFYLGLTMFANMDSGFYDQLHGFLQKATEQSYYDEVQLAQKLLPFGKTAFTIDDYSALAANTKIPNYYKVLLNQRAMRQFKDVCSPYLHYGLFQTSLKNYATAAQFLEEGYTCNGAEKGDETIALDYAYSLYMSGDKSKAQFIFTKLLHSTDTYRKQAAEYFIGRINYEKGDKENSKSMFGILAKSGANTKYNWLARNYSWE